MQKEVRMEYKYLGVTLGSRIRKKYQQDFYQKRIYKTVEKIIWVYA